MRNSSPTSKRSSNHPFSSLLLTVGLIVACVAGYATDMMLILALVLQTIYFVFRSLLPGFSISADAGAEHSALHDDIAGFRTLDPNQLPGLPSRPDQPGVLYNGVRAGVRYRNRFSARENIKRFIAEARTAWDVRIEQLESSGQIHPMIGLLFSMVGLFVAFYHLITAVQNGDQAVIQQAYQSAFKGLGTMAATSGLGALFSICTHSLSQSVNKSIDQLFSEIEVLIGLLDLDLDPDLPGPDDDHQSGHADDPDEDDVDADSDGKRAA